MGAKIITEKDFWLCSSGAMPAQLQGTREGTKTSDGDIYITSSDTATSSWIDFGCTKSMFWDGLIAAVVAVVVVVVVSAVVVATGGAALVGIMGLMAIGAGAGFVGASIGAVRGAMKCGQKLATKRKWTIDKPDFISQNSNTITGAHKMTCEVGGIVQFAPNIKSWLQAARFAKNQYFTKLVEAAFTGAGVGLLGGLVSTWAGLGALTESVSLALPTAASIKLNLAIMGGMRVLQGTTDLEREIALDQVHSAADVGKAYVPEYEAAIRVGTGKATVSDYFLFAGDIFGPFLNIKTGPLAPKTTIAEPPAEITSSPEQFGEFVDSPENLPGSNKDPAPPRPGKAYEDPVYRQDNNPNSPKGSKPGRVKSHINEDGDLVPANKDGKATIQDHIRGSEPRKSDSPYTSFSEGKPGIGKKYGENIIELDINTLKKDIANGKVKDVEIIRPEEVQSELQSKLDEAKQRHESNPTEKNLERVEAAQRDLNNATRDRETLIKGEVPSKYIKVYPNK
jgi:outer membrane lipoprotein SlyB